MLMSAVPMFFLELGLPGGCVALPPAVGGGNCRATWGGNGPNRPSSRPTDLPQVLAGLPEILQQGAPAAGEVSR